MLLSDILGVWNLLLKTLLDSEHDSMKDFAILG
jgi:hypothetical protein